MVVVCPWDFLGASEPAQQQQKESPLAAVTNTQEQPKAMLENEQQNKASYADIAKKGGATQVEIAENALNGSSDASNRRISFAEKVKANASVEIDIAALPIPGMKGNIPSIRIPKQAIDRGLQFCKFSLVGRLDFQKINIDTVRTIAAEKWRPKGCWKIVPLGKGYFMIRLTCEEDLVRIWSGGPWKFENQILRLTKWKPDFDPEIQRISHAMVWVKLPKLKQQFWDYEILMAMGRCIGYPIGIDKTTAARDFGFYASVLVDLDLSKPIPSQIIVEVPDGQDFVQEIELSRLPKFCSHCKTIGHLMSDCKSLQKEIRNEKDINLEKEPRKENQHATGKTNHRRRRMKSAK
ncbi:hypothetical protein IFM89_036174 [Coptis chinensis]|uniref:DUF4283 domain-containing protein n=1 Tax=Coptis chinensis TaxID=261450 RepID=A0A835H2Y3_9MAGN|nr:hypothetical protein IFM89_036174 [Coptis chinensis]